MDFFFFNPFAFFSHYRKQFEGLASNDAFVEAHGALNTLAASLMKIANDIRCVFYFFSSLISLLSLTDSFFSPPLASLLAALAVVLASLRSPRTSLAPPSCLAR